MAEVTDKDLEYLAKIGGRTVTTNPLGKDGNKDKPVDEIIERLKKARTDGEAIRQFNEGLEGPHPPPASAPAAPPPENPAASIVTKAFDSQNNMIKSLQDQSGDLRKEANQLFKDQMSANLEVMNERLKLLQFKEDAILKTAQEAHAGGANRSDLKVFLEVKDELQQIGLWNPHPPALPAPPEKPAGVSDEVHMKLQEMKFNHELRLAEIAATTAREQKAWDVKLLQMQEDSRQRWGEYNDKKNFRESTMGELSTLGQSIAAAVQGGRSVGGAPPAPLSQAGPPVTSEINPAAPGFSQFQCKGEGCDAVITVANGAGAAICPKCGAEYIMKPKGA